MKILMVDKYFFIKGGAERYYFELKKILEKQGHQVIPFSTQHEKNFPSEFEGYFEKNIDLNLSSGLKKIINSPKVVSRIIYSNHSRHLIERLIEKTKPDVAHLHMIDHQLSPSILHSLKKYNIPIVQTVHQYKLICPSYRLYNMRKNRLCEKCIGGNFYNAVIEKCHKDSYWASLLVCAEMYIHRFMKIYDNVDLFHVPSRFLGSMLERGGIDNKKIQHLFYTINIDDYPFNPNFDDYFLYYGRLSGEKGILTLLKAMKRIRHSKLLIVGDGPQRDVLEKYASENNLCNVIFVGNKNGQELKSIVAKAMFVVVPSEWYENSPLVIYESFALGKPVIASAIGGIPELVDHEENGLLFEPQNVTELRQRINALLENPSKTKQMGMQARKKAEKEFNSQRHYEEIFKIYRSLLE